MVNFTPGYSPETPDFVVPDFSKGASAETAAKYFESIGRNDLAQEAEKVQQLSIYPISFVIAPPDIAAYVTPWSSDTISYNLHTIGRDADHEHIVRHESIHLEHQSRWGSTDMPGFSELSPFAQSCFAGTLGTALDERELLEGHTESKATKQTEYDPDCSYNLREVPIAKRFDALIKNRSSLSGLDYSTSRSFSQMDQSSSREDFANGMLLTANQLMLEKAASDMGSKVGDAIATKISYIARDLLQSGKVIKSPEEAKHLLKNSPVSILEIKTKMRGELDRIGIGADEVKSIDRIEPQRSINIFGETLERTENNMWKVVQNNFAGRAVNVLQFPGNAPAPRETDEVMLAA